MSGRLRGGTGQSTGHNAEAGSVLHNMSRCQQGVTSFVLLTRTDQGDGQTHLAACQPFGRASSQLTVHTTVRGNRLPAHTATRQGTLPAYPTRQRGRRYLAPFEAP